MNKEKATTFRTPSEFEIKCFKFLDAKYLKAIPSPILAMIALNERFGMGSKKSMNIYRLWLLNKGSYELIKT